MDEKLYEEEQPSEVENTTATKAWLKNTDKSIARLQNVKKTYYRLGGGPKEREVDCRCNYRCKHRSSFVNMEADPPQLSQQSQETASYQDVPISDLVKAINKSKGKPVIPKQKRRPYSATVSHVSHVSTTGHSTEEVLPASKEKKAFIAVKGQNLNPKTRPKSASYTLQSQQSHQAYMWHLDPDHLEQEEQAKMEGLRKYSAYGQNEESTIETDLPKPPRASPEPSEHTTESKRHDISPEESSDDFISDDDDDFDLELRPLSEHGMNLASPSTSSKPLIFQIPTADFIDDDPDETYKPHASDRALSADYVEKSEVFLDELAKKQTQEAQELTEMFSKMNKNQEKVDNIDLRSVMSSPSSARNVNTPNTQVDSYDVNVLNITLDRPSSREDSTEPVWVEEPYISRIRPNQELSHVPMGRFYSTKLRAQSAKTRRSQDEGAFVLRGKTFELMDAKDLAVTRRLSDKDMEPKKDEVLGKPPRPKSSSLKKKKRANSATTSNSRQRTSLGHAEHDELPPHPPFPRKSSMRKSLSQDDVRCLSPEVLASVKKTVSFSDEVLDKPTRLLKTSGKELDKETIISGSHSNKPELKLQAKRQASQSNSCKPEVGQAEVVSPEVNKPEAKEFRNPLDVSGETIFSRDRNLEKKSAGFVIENGQEAKEQYEKVQQSPCDKVPMNDKPMSSVNVIAKIKEATRCSCHVDECHCRDITRPTMSVLSQARTANQEQTTSPTKHKLLKHRPSRPTSAPIKRDLIQSTTNTTPTRSRLSSATQHKRSGSEGGRRTRPVSAHIKRPSGVEAKSNQPHLKASKDFKSKKTKENDGKTDIGFVWGPGGDEVAASDECQEVYAKFKEKGINISMETVKRGLMAPARRASENCMASFGISSSSGLLSRPEKWLPEEYKRVKIWDKALKQL